MTLIFLAQCEYIANCRGGKLLLINGYTFSATNRPRYINRKVYWRCSSYGICGCRCFAVTQENIVVGMLREHNHEARKYVSVKGKIKWLNILPH